MIYTIVSNINECGNTLYEIRSKISRSNRPLYRYVSKCDAVTMCDWLNGDMKGPQLEYLPSQIVPWYIGRDKAGHWLPLNDDFLGDMLAPDSPLYALTYLGLIAMPNLIDQGAIDNPMHRLFGTAYSVKIRS